MTSVLPPEILHQILCFCLIQPQRRSASALLTTSSLFRDICQSILYSNLHFTSRKQLTLFISTYSSPTCTSPYMPRSVELDITKGDESQLIFVDIHALFSTCLAKSEDAERDKGGRPVLDLLRLRLNSHFFDPQIDMIYHALSSVNPRRFIWTGPDPPHHFSTAIVLQAIPHLFSALESYTNLIYLKLSHFTMNFFPVKELPVIPSLQQLHLGQVIFLHPLIIANFLAHPGSMNIERIHLVDAYRQSIWGPRLRRSDIEAAAASIYLARDSENDLRPLLSAAKNRIHSVVVCEAKTERIIGGDRVEDNRLLL